jgi:hypothetical protein
MVRSGGGATQGHRGAKRRRDEDARRRRLDSSFGQPGCVLVLKPGPSTACTGHRRHCTCRAHRPKWYAASLNRLSRRTVGLLLWTRSSSSMGSAAVIAIGLSRSPRLSPPGRMDARTDEARSGAADRAPARPRADAGEPAGVGGQLAALRGDGARTKRGAPQDRLKRFTSRCARSASGSAEDLQHSLHSFPSRFCALGALTVNERPDLATPDYCFAWKAVLPLGRLQRGPTGSACPCPRRL